MEVILADLVCGICSKVYGHLNPPICLPGCGHSFCYLCITDKIKHSGSVFSCPSCRTVQRDIAVDSLKVNFSLLNVAQQLDTGSSLQIQNSPLIALSEETVRKSEIQDHSPNPLNGQPSYHLEWRIKCVTSDANLNQEQIQKLASSSSVNTDEQLDQPKYRLEWRVRCATSASQLSQELNSRLAKPISSISEDLICCMCIEVYSSTRLPLCLPGCGHTFCYYCLLDLTKHYGNAFPCPSCRSVHRDKAVANLKVNYALLNVAQQLSERLSMGNKNFPPFEQPEEVYKLSEIQEHAFPQFAEQPLYRLQWRVTRVTPDTQVNQEQIQCLFSPSSSNTEEQLLDQPAYRLEWKLRRVTSEIELNQERYQASAVSLNSANDNEMLSRGISLNHENIKDIIKKKILKCISRVADVIKL